MINNLEIHNVKTLSFVGDIHGEFTELEDKISFTHKDSVFIVLGDIGMGFNKVEYYIRMFNTINTKLGNNNNHLVFLRGNHDDPDYFNGVETELPKYSNIHLVPDYTVVSIFYEDKSLLSNVLCVGGGISIDRIHRKEADSLEREGKQSYWENEQVVLDLSKLEEINLQFKDAIHIVATHSSPNFCYPYIKDGVRDWILMDDELEKDIDIERGNLTEVFNTIKDSQSNLTHWYYGHYHRNLRETISDVTFNLCGICSIKRHYVEESK